MRFVRLAAAVAALGFGSVSSAWAQQFEPGSTHAGARVWIGNLNGAMSVGGQVERAITQPGDVGPGIISGGVGIDYYKWSQDYTVGRYSYSVVPIQAFSNYHFVIEKNRRFDPYVGLALVYSVVNASWSGSGVGNIGASGSGMNFAGQAGLRYFVSERFALQGQVGFGYGTLGLGAGLRL